MGGVDVGGHAPAHVKVGLALQHHLSRGRVAQFRPVAAVLVHVPDVEAVGLGLRHEVDGVAMSEAGVVERTAVVVHTEGPIGDLVLAVAVHIGHTQVVVALSAILVAGAVGQSEAVHHRHLPGLRVGVVVPL